MTQKPGLIDRALVLGDLLFTTRKDRCCYGGLSARNQPLWLESNWGKWQRIQDVQKEAAPLAPPVDSETKVAAAPAGPNGPRDVQKDGEGKDGVALPDALLGDSSRPCEPTSIPTPVKENATDGSKNAELLRPAKAAIREAVESHTESTLLGTIGRKRGRSGDRQLKKQKPPAGISKASPRLSPELMRLVLDALSEYPILYHAADTAGIHRKTLKYWMDRSEAGDDGYDIEWQDITWRFHEHCKSAIYEAHQELIDIMFQRAFVGYDKVLTYRGRVSYKMDQGLVGLGYQGPDAYLKDENGNPVPETVPKVDTKAQRFILEWYRYNTWGKHPKIDAPREGGVLVIGDMTKKPEYNTAASVNARKWKAWSKKIRRKKSSVPRRFRTTLSGRQHLQIAKNEKASVTIAGPFHKVRPSSPARLYEPTMPLPR